MFEEIFNDKNQKRRKGNMLKNGIRFLVLLFLLVVPIKAWGGEDTSFLFDTDSPGFQLFYFWDTRDRQSFFQVTNTSSGAIKVHVQIFNVPGEAINCDEVDFDDSYTGQDTHVYDLSNIVLNDGSVFGPVFPDGAYGFAVVSVSDVSGNTDSSQPVIIGNFRVIDDAGYEYRSNAASYNDSDDTFAYSFNFNDIDGTAFSDVVGIFVQNAGGGYPEVIAQGHQGSLVKFDPTIFNDTEKDFSCPNVVFTCIPSDGDQVPFIIDDEGDVSVVGFDLGINDELVNSKGEPSICNGSLSTGFVAMNIIDIDDDAGDGYFVGYIGLNNGDGTGSMDTWTTPSQEVVSCTIAGGPVQSNTAMANMLLMALVPAFVIGFRVMRRRERKEEKSKKMSRFSFIVIASIMLLFLGVGTSKDARAQLCEDCLCPGLDISTGWFDIVVDGGAADFTAGLLGTIESLGAGAPNIGGIDWLYNDLFYLNTTLSGTQLITWWSQVDSRNTYIQVANTVSGICSFSGTACATSADCPNTDPFTNTCIGAAYLEVKILDESCNELTNFCDPYTPFDTHVYNLGDLVDNNGNNRNDAVLQGHEGVFVVTPVDNCDDENAIAWNFLTGNLRLIDEGNDTDYGTNVYTREAVYFQTFENSLVFEPGDPCIAGTVLEDDDDTPLCSLVLSQPSQLKQNFSEVGVAAASDLVFISFTDDFGPPYGIVPGKTAFAPDDFCDDAEKCDSCPGFTACFARYGLDDEIPISEDFAPPTPTPSPTPPPTTPPPTTPPPTPTPTSPPGGGGGGCSLVGSTVQLGTAMANILIPLVPAFAIGYRVIRRRGRKEGK
jgi:hypothetical protein